VPRACQGHLVYPWPSPRCLLGVGATARSCPGTAQCRLLPPLRLHHRCQHSPSTIRLGRHLLEDHTVALVLPRLGIGRPRPRTTPSPSRFPARVAQLYTNLLVSFPSSPPPQITSPPLLEPLRIGSPPPHHRPSPKSAGLRHQHAIAAPPLLRPWALRQGVARPCCRAGLDADVGCQPKDRPTRDSWAKLEASRPWPSATVLRPNFC
jgi:hypothetical protein